MTTKEKFANCGVKYSFYTRFFKRFLDFVLALLLIIVLSVFLLLFEILTLIFNGFPAIYKQARPGKDHKVFYIYKFRSMNNKKDKNGNLLPDNQRITFWGRIIRKTSIDELPQLFNILKGDMSFVGTRPKLVKDIMFYEKDVFDQYILRPGLTGYCQVYGRNKNTWEDTFEKDKYYLSHVSLWLDIKIFFMSFISVFVNRGVAHDSTEEDKAQEKEQEYYYADYLIRIGKVSDEQYKYGIELSKSLSKKHTNLEFAPEIRDAELFKKTQSVAEKNE